VEVEKGATLNRRLGRLGGKKLAIIKKGKVLGGGEQGHAAILEKITPRDWLPEAHHMTRLRSKGPRKLHPSVVTQLRKGKAIQSRKSRELCTNANERGAGKK